MRWGKKERGGWKKAAEGGKYHAVHTDPRHPGFSSCASNNSHEHALRRKLTLESKFNLSRAHWYGREKKAIF